VRHGLPHGGTLAHRAHPATVSAHCNVNGCDLWSVFAVHVGRSHRLPAACIWTSFDSVWCQSDRVHILHVTVIGFLGTFCSGLCMIVVRNEERIFAMSLGCQQQRLVAYSRDSAASCVNIRAVSITCGIVVMLPCGSLGCCWYDSWPARCSSSLQGVTPGSAANSATIACQPFCHV
jgi:hypothetical protein